MIQAGYSLAISLQYQNAINKILYRRFKPCNHVKVGAIEGKHNQMLVILKILLIINEVNVIQINKEQ